MKDIAASTDVPIEYVQASVRKQVFHSKDVRTWKLKYIGLKNSDNLLIMPTRSNLDRLCLQDINEPMFLEEARPMKFRIVYMRRNNQTRSPDATWLSSNDYLLDLIVIG